MVYSPYVLEGVFCELRPEGVLQSSSRRRRCSVGRIRLPRPGGMLPSLRQARGGAFILPSPRLPRKRGLEKTATFIVYRALGGGCRWRLRSGGGARWPRACAGTTTSPGARERWDAVFSRSGTRWSGTSPSGASRSSRCPDGWPRKILRGGPRRGPFTVVVEGKERRVASEGGELFVALLVVVLLLDVVL